MKKGLLVYAYVIMPSHIHLIECHDEAKLNQVIQNFKSFSAKEILQSIGAEVRESRREWLIHMFQYFARHQKQNAKYMFWKKTNHPIELSYPAVKDKKSNMCTIIL